MKGFNELLAAAAMLALFSTPYTVPRLLLNLESNDLTPAARVAPPPIPESAQPVLSFPIPYDAIVIQAGNGIDKPVARYYVRPSQK